MLRGKIPHEKFDSELWKTANLNSENNLSLRWDMMNDLRNKHKLDKLSQEETIELLGKPDGESENEYRYYLGNTKRGINTGSLMIIFDDKKKVKQYYVWQG